jgi:hypothetical protein
MGANTRWPFNDENRVNALRSAGHGVQSREPGELISVEFGERIPRCEMLKTEIMDGTRMTVDGSLVIMLNS